MVLSAFLAFSTLILKRKVYFRGAKDDTNQKTEQISALMLFFEVFLISVWDYLKCDKGETRMCLVSMQEYLIVIVIAIIIVEALYTKFSLIFIIMYSIYDQAEYFKDYSVKVLVIVKLAFAAYEVYNVWKYRKADWKTHAHLLSLLSCSAYMMYTNQKNFSHINSIDLLLILICGIIWKINPFTKRKKNKSITI